MPRFAANISMMFTEVAFAERFAAASDAGFAAVECLLPYEMAADEVADRLKRHGLVQALFNAPAGNWAGGDRGLAALPGREAEFERSIGQVLDYAGRLEPRSIHVMAGLAVGAQARATYVANLKRITAMAPDQIFTVEPINHRDMPGYHLTTTADARAVIEAVGAANLKLQLDLYHCQITEGDLTRRIEDHAAVIGHVQIAGVPDRNEPDRGELNVRHLMETLDRVGYAGWVGCEYRPLGATTDGLGWLADWR